MSNWINWGIIGCGDVTEVKSGPAFNKIDRSSLHAVMRRNSDKAKDYAERHKVPVWYDNADELISDSKVNAIYIATPPAYHEEYAIKALEAGKNVYVEKPMALTASGSERIAQFADISGAKLSVAHYRRAMPFFVKIKELINANTIGQILFVNLKMFQGVENDVISKSKDNWRLDPLISGGGLFYDLAPHQIDMMIYLFGSANKASGLSSISSESAVPDLISGQILLSNNILFNGLWCFNCPEEENADLCEIVGSEGKISFPFYGDRFILSKNRSQTEFHIPAPKHVQQPMIEQVVKYFLNEDSNPCDASIGVDVLRIMEAFSIQQHQINGISRGSVK